MFENIKDIILIILVIIVIYLLYKTTFNEKFTNDAAQAAALALVTSNKEIINESVKNMYKADIDAMRNLAQIAQKILTPIKTGSGSVTDLLDTPAQTVKINDLVVEGDVKFTNKNTKFMNIFPKYMVIAWANSDIPKGWVLCNGERYTIDDNGITSVVTRTTSGYSNIGELTPDLRGRFILGSGIGVIYDKTIDGNYTAKRNSNLTERILNERDGVEKVALLIDQMPAHKHYYAQAYGWDDNKLNLRNVTYPENSGTSGNIFTNDQGEYRASNTPNTSVTGKGEAHENMPPFYVLTYIMKL
jgi:microcystin-dependent protein